MAPRDLAAERVDRESEVLWMREMFGGSYRPEFMTVSTPQGDIEALTFVMDPGHERYIPEMPVAEAAEISGYASESAFSRVVKKEIGLSPAAFRHACTERQRAA